MTDSTIVSKIWNLAGVLRDDGVVMVITRTNHLFAIP